MEEVAAAKKRREIRPGFVLSILLHVLFIAIFLLPLLPAPPQAKPEDSVNVELVPQPEEKKEVATKENEKPDQPPKPTPKPDEKPQQQTAEAQQEPQQPQGKKSDEQPPKQSDPQGKEPTEKPSPKSDEAKADKPEEQAEKPAPKSDDGGADKPVDKAEQKPSATETPLPDMKGEEKDATTTQQAEASAQPSDTPQTPPNDTAAAQQAEAQAAAAQAQAQAEQAQQQADAQSQEANAAKPPASDSTAKASSSAPNVLTTNEPSDSQVQQPQAQSADQNDPQAQAAAQAPSSDPQQQTPAEPTKEEAKTEPKIAVPTVRPSPTEQASQSQSTSGSQGGQTSGTALVTEPQPPKSLVPKRAIEAKKLYSGAEIARLSKSDYDAWKKMPRRDRVRYLCNSEEKLQFGRELRAVGYGYYNSALSPAMLSDISLFGDGVAVQTPDGWQRVEFTCQVDSDALKVVAFSYAVKGHISPSQLERLGTAGN